MTYFLDTNIISYIIKGNLKIRTKLVELLSDGNEVKIPAIAYYEVKRGLIAAKGNSKLQQFLLFSQKLGMINTTIDTYDLAAQIYANLRSEGRIIEDADIFIGAMSLEHNAILITNNVEHLSRITDIQTEEWGI